MSKKNGYRNKKNISEIKDTELESILDSNLEENDIADIDELTESDLAELDEDMAERLAYYENIDDTEDVADDDIEEKDDIREFRSRDYDIIAESRKRVNQPGNRVDRRSRSNGERQAKSRKGNSGRNKRNEQIGIFRRCLDKWLEIYHKYTMKILYGALGTLAAILLVVCIITLSSEEGNDQLTPANETSSEIPSSTGEAVTGETVDDNSIQPEAEESTIHTLVSSFIDAAYIKADMEQVKLYVDDVTNINVDKYKNRQKYIESYQNIKCYKLESAIENSYIVFVTYDMKLYNIDTLAPSAEQVIVKYNEADGKYYIHNMTVGEELDGYIAAGSKIERISEISADVEKRLEEALANDEDLKKVFDIMANVGKQQEESTASEQ